MYKKITKERADEITAAWDAATDVQRLGMPRIQWLYVSGGNDETDYWEHEPPPLEKAAAARIAELEAALRPFAAIAGVGAPRIKIDPAVDRLWSYYDSRADHQHEITRAHINEAARILKSQ